MPNPLESIDLSMLQGIPLSTLILRGLVALGVILVGRWIAKVIVVRLERILQAHETDPTIVRFVLSISYPLLLLIVAVTALGVIGINTSSLLALLGAVFLAIGLALQDSLKNFAAGVMLIAFRPFDVGDYIALQGQEGTVESISLVNTVLRTPDNLGIVIPNGQVNSGTIVNFSANPVRRIDLVVGIGYDDDLRKAKELLEAILRREDRVLDEPAPVVAVAALADSSVNLDVRPWVKTSDFLATRYALIERIKLEFDANGISIPYPQMDVSVRTSNGAG